MKHIKEALVALKAKAHDDGDDGAWNLALAAEEEVADIERAAMSFTRPVQGRLNDSSAAWALLELIAKEAP